MALQLFAAMADASLQRDLATPLSGLSVAVVKSEGPRIWGCVFNGFSLIRDVVVPLSKVPRKSRARLPVQRAEPWRPTKM